MDAAETDSPALRATSASVTRLLSIVLPPLRGCYLLCVHHDTETSFDKPDDVTQYKRAESI
jgi:hypothetical protein